MRIHYYFELAKIVLISFPLPLSVDIIRYKLLSLQQTVRFFVRQPKKMRRKFAVYEKVVTFAASNKGVGCKVLFYGVMVAQQILVLFVLVRIRVEQLILVFSSERARIFFACLTGCRRLAVTSGISGYSRLVRIIMNKALSLPHGTNKTTSCDPSRRTYRQL